MTTACGLCERELHGDQAGHYLCPPCTRGTGERLAALPGLYEALLLFLAPGSPALGPRVSRGVAGAVLPIPEPVLGLRGPGGIVGVVDDWRAALHSDRGWTEPRGQGSYEQRLQHAVRGLSDNLPWIAGSWPVAGAFAEEIRDLHRDVTGIVDPPERTIRVGNCPAVYEDGALCGAVLRTLPDATHIECRWCGAAFPPETWLTLRSWIIEDEKTAL